MACSFFQLADLLGKKWTTVVLQEITLHGSSGFNTIHLRMRISSKVLAQRLRELERLTLIQKEIIPGVPVRSKYFLTPKGKELYTIIEGLRKWNQQYADGPPCGDRECVTCPQY